MGRHNGGFQQALPCPSGSWHPQHSRCSLQSHGRFGTISAPIARNPIGHHILHVSRSP